MRKFMVITILATFVGCEAGSAPDDANDDSATKADDVYEDGDDGDDEAREHVPEQGVSFVEANGLRFGYLEAGEGPLVLLLHGFPDTARTWDPIRQALADAGYHAVSPFMRGYTPTGIPSTPDDFSAEALGIDAIELIEALGYDSAVVVGHDWGAYAAYSAASLAPERVDKLVTIAIPHPGFFVPDAGFLERGAHFVYLAQPDAFDVMAADDFAHVDELYRRWSPTWNFDVDELEPAKNAFAAEGCLDAALGYYRAASPVPPEFLRRPLEMPALTIAGNDDGVMLPELFDQTEPAYAAGGRIVKLPGGHFVHRESQDAATKEILDFLAGS